MTIGSFSNCNEMYETRRPLPTKSRNPAIAFRERSHCPVRARSHRLSTHLATCHACRCPAGGESSENLTVIGRKRIHAAYTHLQPSCQKPSFTMTRSLRLLARRCSSIVRIGTDDPRMSKVVIHRGVVYTSGQTAADAGDCVEKQTKSCLAKIDALLAEAGTSKSNALNATIWLKDIEADFKRMNGVWNKWVEADNKPTRATVQAAMARPSILVEIQVTAALPE